MAPTVLRPTAVHLVPICSSAVTVGLSLLQLPVFYAFLTARPSLAGRTLSSYWNTFVYQSIGFIISPILISAATGYAAARSLAGTTAAPWYRFGALAAAGHLAFAYTAAQRIKQIARGAEDLGTPEVEVVRRNRALQWSWLGLHALRTAVVDIPAFALFVKGFSNAFI